MIRVISFGFKHGEPKAQDKVYDCRHIRNPHVRENLRAKNGLDDDVSAYVFHDPKAKAVMQQALRDVEAGAQFIAFGCFGGKHRSVAIAHAVVSTLNASGKKASALHRDIKRK